MAKPTPAIVAWATFARATPTAVADTRTPAVVDGLLDDDGRGLAGRRGNANALPTYAVSVGSIMARPAGAATNRNIPTPPPSRFAATIRFAQQLHQMADDRQAQPRAGPGRAARDRSTR